MELEQIYAPSYSKTKKPTLAVNNSNYNTMVKSPSTRRSKQGTGTTITPRSLNSKKKVKPNKTYSALNMPMVKDKMRDVGKSHNRIEGSGYKIQHFEDRESHANMVAMLKKKEMG